MNPKAKSEISACIKVGLTEDELYDIVEIES